ncbi:2TM domain-containing protein [Alisedimentitalea sp. MJ-SS2]|uniref:2TM domain-containing protein n=1 Tax=Aliisedimentitalea sp. MJ-SS2 TaxID=3049795 RepID=UPI002907B0C3|nr:2TM domain-containing protein [Alisedimentitalea sp. MJ-SS2]MDU8928726.1 2TM domain-containing protein [Alisedimentitalea sp. MJ-SS2]
MQTSNAYAAAKRRAKAKYGFFVHVAVFVVVMVLLIAINVLTLPETNWTIWPLMGWGLAVVLHGLRVFVFSGRNVILEAMTERELRDHKPHGE